MDPLSITAATIGVSSVAITSISSVRNTINNIKDAEKAVGDIRTQLENIERTARFTQDTHDHRCGRSHSIWLALSYRSENSIHSPSRDKPSHCQSKRRTDLLRLICDHSEREEFTAHLPYDSIHFSISCNC